MSAMMALLTGRIQSLGVDLQSESGDSWTLKVWGFSCSQQNSSASREASRNADPEKTTSDE